MNAENIRKDLNKKRESDRMDIKTEDSKLEYRNIVLLLQIKLGIESIYGVINMPQLDTIKATDNRKTTLSMDLIYAYVLSIYESYNKLTDTSKCLLQNTKIAELKHIINEVAHEYDKVSYGSLNDAAEILCNGNAVEIINKTIIYYEKNQNN